MSKSSSVEHIDEAEAAALERRGFFKSVRNYFREYCQCTSVHGFRYFGEKRTIFERVWWFFVFTTCIVACAYSIYTVYQKWENSPVIVSFATRGAPIYSIPFPTVTVCPEIKSRQEAFNYTDIMQKKRDNATAMEPSEESDFEYMSLICDRKEDVEYMNNDTFSDEFFTVIDQVKPNFTILNCYYMGKKVDCKGLFTPLITDEGVCYTFNMLDRSEIYRKTVVHFSNYHQVPKNTSRWSIQNGYSPEVGTEAYPRRALLAGVKNALKFNLVSLKEDVDYACKNSLQGYRIILHTAMRVPRPSQQYFRLPLDQEVMGAIQPSMITTSESVKLYNPKRRECYFPSERHLRYFKIYSQLNCQMECLTNYTLHYCGCVNFFMPRENGTEICGTGSIECLKEAEIGLQMKDLRRKLNKPRARKFKTKPRKIRNDCDCMPICTDLTYDVETSQTDWNWFKQYQLLKGDHGRNLTKDSTILSKVSIYFKSDQFMSSERNELYGISDLISNFGGLIGLFTGFSMISAVEIIYFLSLRMVCNERMYGRWSGPVD